MLLLLLQPRDDADELVNQNEVLTVASVSADGRTITTQQTIKFNHYG
jgi:hypothetical protein